MAGTGKGDGQGGGAGKLESQIYCIKYTLFCFNIILWLFGVSIFALTLWICIEPGFNEWMRLLELQKYFIGIYIILIAALGIMAVAFLGCGAALMENIMLLYGFIGSQIALFVFGLIGACVVLDFSTYDSSIQPIIRDVITRLINNPQHEGSRQILRMVQEGIGCCGADGPIDYITLRKPLPAECRDSVTGNAYFHGCVDEMTWYLEGKTGWLAGIVLAACLVHVVNAVMSYVLIQAVRKEEQESTHVSPGHLPNRLMISRIQEAQPRPQWPQTDQDEEQVKRLTSNSGHSYTESKDGRKDTVLVEK